MNAELLVAKTRLPPLPLDWVARPRLSSKLLNDVLRHRLVLLSAPAGYGKTTLAIEALRGAGRPVGWLALDSTDNLSATFLAYLIRSLQSIRPGICQPLLNALQSPQPPPMDSLLTALVNSLSDCPDDSVLVLDDYHTIEAEAVHDVTALIVEHLPPQVHLVITSRIDPPLPLPRWRVRGDLAEMRVGDLCFTREEADAFFRHALGVALSAQDLATLERRTEGWMAGLKMAALSLRGKADVSRSIDAFSGNNHYVLDYLADEVLNRQSPPVRQFLLETSVLERLCGPLCDAVTGHSDSQSVLRQLELANLFISALDDERGWYRYHQFFATILRNQLAKSGPERLALLHLRASAWYERQGLTEEAISHAFLGGDAERAADILQNAAPHMIARGQVPQVLDYVSRIPQHLLPARPELCLAFAWAALLSSQWDLLSTMLSRASAALPEDPERLSPFSRAHRHHIQGHLLCIRGIMAQAQGDVIRSIELAEEADREIPPSSPLTRCANSHYLGLSYAKAGDIVRAIAHLEKAVAAARECGSYIVALSAQASLAEMEMQRSALDRAAAICEDAIAYGTTAGGAYPLPHTALAYLVLGQMLYERDDLAGAAANLEQGVELAEASLVWTWVLKGSLMLAVVSQARGNLEAATAYSCRVAEVAPLARLAREARQAPAWKARLALQRGDLASASAWAEQQEASQPLSELPACGQEFDYFTLARFKLAQGECLGLPPALGEIARRAERQARHSTAIQALVLQAFALHRLADHEGAQEVLDRALTLAEPGGYVRTFLDEGDCIAELLARIVASGRHVAYASQLLHSMAPTGPGQAMNSARRAAVPGLVEALSERELEVLRLIAAGKSNREIGSELFLAIGTVKKHTSNIYGKLGVDSRTQAVARARELNIL